MAVNYAGYDADVVCDGGGAVRVTIPATPFQVVANAGVSIPCRKVYITQVVGNTGQVRVNIWAVASSTVGINVPKGATTAANGPGQMPPLELNIADVNMLNFYSSTENDTVDVLYIK